MPTLIDSYSESNMDTPEFVQFFVSGNTAYAQSFTGADKQLDSAVFYLKTETGTPTGNMVATLYTHDGGTFGSNGLPTGSPLATSDNFDVSTLTGSFQLITFNFTGANRYLLNASTKYFIAIEWPGSPPGTDLINAGADTTSPTHAGNWAHFVSGAWQNDGGFYDLCFYVYGTDLSAGAASIFRGKQFLLFDDELNRFEFLRSYSGDTVPPTIMYGMIGR